MCRLCLGNFLDMLKRIKKISASEGVFRDFSWEESCPDFAKYNVIYGLNGTGKTVLSNYLLDEGEGKKIVDGEWFKVEGDSIENLAVFNKRYVSLNFFINDQRQIKGIIKSGIVLGEEEKEKQDKIKILNEKFEKLESKKTNIEKEISDRAKNIKDFFAGTIYGNKRDILNYNKTKFEEKLKNVDISNIRNMILIDNDFERYNNIRNQLNRKDAIALIKIDDLEKFEYNDICKILADTPNGISIDRLVGLEEELSSWIRKGFDIHKEDKKFCEFCTNKLPNNLIDNLKKHFDDDTIIQEENLRWQMEEIDNKINFLNKISNEIKILSFSDEERKNKISQQIKFYKKEKSIYIENILTIKNKLNEKIHNIYSIVELENSYFKSQCYDDSFRQIINKINEIITSFNDAQRNIENDKKIAVEKILDHKFAVECDAFVKFVKERKVNNLCDDFSFNTPIESINCCLEKLNLNKNELQKELDEKKYDTEYFAENINQALSAFLGGSNLRLKANKEKMLGYYITRNNERAEPESLSEGEKTFITFLYFLLSLERGYEISGDASKEKNLIVIDDPVSSLDDVNFYDIFTFMKERISAAQQVIILTHNFNFLRRINQWFKNKDLPSKQDNKEEKKKRRKCAFFMLEKSNHLSPNTKIIKMPNTLKNTAAIFPHLFNRLYLLSIQENISSNNDNVGVPNLIRRFLESYLAVWGLDSVDIVSDLKKLWGGNGRQVKEQVKNIERFARSLLEYLNDFSHANPNITAYNAVIQLKERLIKLFNYIEEHDSVFFKAMCNCAEERGDSIEETTECKRIKAGKPKNQLEMTLGLPDEISSVRQS